MLSLQKLGWPKLWVMGSGGVGSTLMCLLSPPWPAGSLTPHKSNMQTELDFTLFMQMHLVASLHMSEMPKDDMTSPQSEMMAMSPHFRGHSLSSLF